MTFSADMDAILADHGTDLERVSDGSTVRMILDRTYAEALGVAGEQIRGTVAGSVAAGLVVGETFAVDGETLEVVSSPRFSMDQSMASVVLATRGFEATLVAGDAGLSVIYIDEDYPLYPLAEPFPPDADPELLVLRRGASSARLLFQVGPLPGLVGMKLDTAELWVCVVAPAAAPGWKTYRVLQSMEIAQTNWTRYRLSRSWSEAGCSEAGVDHGATEYGAGTGGDEWVLLASGQPFVDAVSAAKTAAIGFIVKDVSGTGEAVFLSGSESNGELRPYLRLTYRKARG